MPQPPEKEDKPMVVWPYWPIKLRTSSSHDEGCEREFAIATKGIHRREGQAHRRQDRPPQMGGRQMTEVEGSEQILKADLALLAMGFVSPVATVLKPSASRRTRAATARPAPRARTPTRPMSTRSSPPATYAAQNLVVWAIRPKYARRREGGG